MYWPKDVGPEARVTYGFFEVQLEREEVLANYTVRTMKLKHLKVREREGSFTSIVQYNPMNKTLLDRKFFTESTFSQVLYCGVILSEHHCI